MRMISLFIISSLSVFFFAQENSIVEFSKTQKEFSVVKNFKNKNFVYAIEKNQLFDSKLEVSLKAKKLHSNKESYYNSVYTKIHLWQYNFRLEADLELAIDSLLNCFPYSCAKIDKQKDIGLKITPSIWIITKKEIYIAQTFCEHVGNEWLEFKKDLVETFANNNSEIIITKCGKLTWTSKEEILNENKNE